MNKSFKINDAKNYFLTANKLVWRKYAIKGFLRSIYLLVFAGLFFTTKSDFEKLRFIFIGIAIGLILCALFNLFILLRQKNEFDKVVNDFVKKFAVDNSFVIEMTDDVLIYKDVYVVRSESWKMFTNYSESGEYLFLYPTQFPVLKSLFTQSELEEFRAFLSSYRS